MLPQASLNYEHFDFSTSFPRKFTIPTSVRPELFKPFRKCAFLVRLNVSRSNVRFSKVTSFPSRKQMWGFDMCPNAWPRKWRWAAALRGQPWLAKPGSAAKAGAVHHKGVLWGGQLSARGALSLEREGSLSFPPFRGVSFCEHQEYLCADCWGHGQQNCWRRWPCRGL